MIDMNSTSKVTHNLTINNPGMLKAEKVEEREEKGTEIAGRQPVSIDEVNQNDKKHKKDLITEVKENLEKLNDYIPMTGTNLIFEFDELGDPPFIKVLDKESEEVIREIPTKEFREVAKALDEFAEKLTNKGLLFNKTA